MKIRYLSLYGPLGQAVAAKRLILALARAGAQVSWTPMVPGPGLGLGHEPFAGRSVGDADLDRFCNRPLDAEVVVVHMRPEYYPAAARLFPGGRVVGHLVWETDRLPPRWPKLIERAERIVVPSHWNRRVCLAAGVSVPVEVVPHVAAALTPAGPRLNAEQTVFYTIGTWTARKALPLVVQAYRAAFRSGEDVVLIVKTTPTAYFESRLVRFSLLQRLWGSTRRTLGLPGLRRRPTSTELVERTATPGGWNAPIEVVCDELTDADIEALHRRGDCFVSLTRGEAWGLPAFDAATLGNPVVMTGFGGQMDYLDAELAGIVGFDLVPVRDDDDPANFQRDQRWAAPRVEEAVRHLREVHEHPEHARAKAAVLRRRILASFSEEVVAQRFFAALGGG